MQPRTIGSTPCVAAWLTSGNSGTILNANKSSFLLNTGKVSFPANDMLDLQDNSHMLYFSCRSFRSFNSSLLKHSWLPRSRLGRHMLQLHAKIVNLSIARPRGRLRRTNAYKVAASYPNERYIYITSNLRQPVPARASVRGPRH